MFFDVFFHDLLQGLAIPSASGYAWCLKLVPVNQQWSEKRDIWVILMLWNLLHVDFIGLLVMNSDLKQVLLVHLYDY